MVISKLRKVFFVPDKYMHKFKNAIEYHEGYTIKSMLINALIIDPELFDYLSEMVPYINIIYDEHDGQQFDESISNWDRYYVDYQMYLAMSNFSHERIDHIKKVIQTPEANHFNPNSEYKDYAFVGGYH